MKGSAALLRPRQLLLELQRLTAENEKLREENIKLRGEVTRLRLYNQLEIAGPDYSGHTPLPEAVPEGLRKFYYILPHAFDQEEFFRLADDLGYNTEQAQHIISLYMRERMLVHKNLDRFEKADLYQYELPLA